MLFKYGNELCNHNGILTTQKTCQCFFGYYGNNCMYKNKCYFTNCFLNKFCGDYEDCEEICDKIKCDQIQENDVENPSYTP